MQEFRLAKMEMNLKKYHNLIIIMIEPVDIDALPTDLQTYLRSSSYIGASKLQRNTEKYEITFPFNHITFVARNFINILGKRIKDGDVVA